MPSMTPGVVLVPVDTEPGYTDTAIGQRLWAKAQGLAVQGIILVQATRPASLAARRDIRAGHDPIVNWQGADEGPLVILVGHVVGLRQADACSAGSVKREGGEYSSIVKTKVYLDSMFKTPCVVKHALK